MRNPGAGRRLARASCLASLVWVLCLPGGLTAASQASQDRQLVVPRLDDVAEIDGRLDDPMWQQAAVADRFTQREPRAGEPAEARTEVRLYYTTDYLLVGARLFDPEPSRIVASEYVRDADLESNDTFEIFLDTFRDGRNAFYFATNAVGAQRDGLVRDEGDALNFEWDGVWRVAGARDADGWTAEIAIPFSTLRFRPGSAIGWGVNFGRIVARTREESFWTPIERDWGFLGKWRVSGFGQLLGLEEARAGGRLQLKPFALGGTDENGEEQPGDVDPTLELGLDAKVALSPTVVADLTLNTDFAQVESDQEQVNLTRFPLFFPEKREFFLENAGLFQVGERIRPFEPPSTILFFSRRIGLTDDGDPVPLIGGARVTGKIGRYDLGAMSIVADDLDTGGGEDGDEPLPRTSFAALRIKRDVRERSSIGAMVLSKTPGEEGASNHVASVDMALALPRNASLAGFAAQSVTPGLRGSAHAVGVDLNWESDRAGLVGSYVDIGDDFNSEMGFIPRTGIRKYRLAANLARRPGRLGIRQLFFGNDHTYIANRSGALETQINNLGPAFLFEDGGFLFVSWQNAAEGLTEPFEIRDDVFIPEGTYRFNQAVAVYQGDRGRRLSARGFATVGGFFDGTIRSFNVAGQYRPHARLTVELELFTNDVRLPIARGHFVDNVVIARAVYAFSANAFVRGLVQVNDADREMRTNVVFRYTYRPGSDLFVVYNEDRGIRGETPAIKRRQVLVKLTRHWVR